MPQVPSGKTHGHGLDNSWWHHSYEVGDWIRKPFQGDKESK